MLFDSSNSIIADLPLYSVFVQPLDLVNKVFTLFDSDIKLSGVIINNQNTYITMLSRNRFYEIMSKQYMFELFAKKKVLFFIEEKADSNILILPSDTRILDAANYALQRDLEYRNDPIVVKFDNNIYKLLDFYELITAQTLEHLKTLDSLEKANEFKKDVIGMSAHELKNPLNAIIGFASIIEDSENNDVSAEIKSYAAFIHNAGRQMNDLLNEILQLAIKDASTFELVYSSFNINDLVRHTVLQFEKIASDKKQILTIKTDYDDFNIQGDKNKLREVLENLISNALKYSPSDTMITISTSLFNSDFFRISISDKGQGFTEEDLQSIFNKFQRLSAKPTGSESSTGLGLYIVKKIVNSHNGFIYVKNNEDIGCTVTVDLPLNGHQPNSTN